MKCPVCNQYDFKDEYDICRVCFWENDPLQNENPTCLGANRTSLIEYKKIGKKLIRYFLN